MDMRTDISWFSDDSGSWRSKDILIFSDGGFRSKRGAASAAWVVIERPPIALDRCGVYGSTQIIGKGVIFLDAACSSSFMAEALALEAASIAVLSRRGGCPLTNVGIPIIFETATMRTVLRCEQDHTSG